MMFCLNLDPTPLKLDDLRTLSVLVKKKGGRKTKRKNQKRKTRSKNREENYVVKYPL